MSPVERRARGNCWRPSLMRSGFVWSPERKSGPLTDPQEAAVRAIVSALGGDDTQRLTP